MKKILKNIAINSMLIMISIFICCIFMEIGLRLSGYGAVGKRNGNVVHYVNNEFKHEAVLNSLELRDSEITEKKHDEFRILAIGDSFTYGLGVDEDKTFVRQTEKLLCQFASNTFSSTKFRIINCGGVGGGPIQQSEWLRETGLSFNPDMVVQSFFIGNDVYDDLAWHPNKTNNNIKPSADIPKKSYQFNTLKKFMLSDWLWFRLVSIPFFDKMLFDCGLRYTDRGLFLRNLPELEKKALKNTLNAILDTKQLLEKKNIPFLLMIIPTSDQVRYGNNRPADEDFSQPNKILVKFFKDYDINFIDLLPLMEKDSEKSSMYYVRDLHWTVKGHKFAATILANKISFFLVDQKNRQ